MLFGREGNDPEENNRMILYVGVYRVSDGLPLVATTDIGQSPKLNDCQKYIKTISKRLMKFPDRCLLRLEGFTVLFISALGITFIALCEESYPNVLAYCFLDEVQKEFIVRYDNNKVSSARRPYIFIEYEPFLKKTKQRYNSPRTLSTRVNLSDMSTELKLRPPHEVTESDMVVSNGRRAAYDQQSIPALVSGGIHSLDWVTVLSMSINVFCALMNLIRGMAIISHGHFDDLDSGAYRFGSCFLFASLLCAYQVYLMVSVSRRKRFVSAAVLLSQCLMQYFLQNFRNVSQIAFHLSAAVFASYVILKRKSRDKLPGYNV